MMPLVLDTTVLIDALRGRPVAARIAHLARAGEVLMTTPINVEEVTRGLRDPEQTRAELLFDGLQVVPVLHRDGELAGRWRGEHARRGITLHQADCLIAAVTARVSSRLATANVKDFPFPDLTVEEWPIGV